MLRTEFARLACVQWWGEWLGKVVCETESKWRKNYVRVKTRLLCDYEIFSPAKLRRSSFVPPRGAPPTRARSWRTALAHKIGSDKGPSPHC